MKRSNRMFVLLSICFFLTACAIPGVGVSSDEQVHNPFVTLTVTVPPPPQMTVTPTYPCPQTTQELPPRVQPLTSPTSELSQVVVVRPGNYDEATVETESGTYTAKFEGAQGARVEVTLLPNTVHHLKVTVRVHESSYNGCTYGGYSMSVFSDEEGHPLEITQGNPAEPLPSTEALGPDNFDRIQQLNYLNLSEQQRPWNVIFSQDDLLLTFGFGQGVYRWEIPSGQLAGGLMTNSGSMTTAVALSPDGKWMATGSGGWDTNDDNQTSVRLWNLQSGEVWLLGHHPDVVDSLAFNPSSTQLASGSGYNTIIFWDVMTGEQIGKFEGGPVKRANGDGLIQRVMELFWEGDSQVIARGDAVTYTLRAPTGEKLFELIGDYLDIDYNPVTRTLALVKDDGVYMKKADSEELVPLLENGGASAGYQQVAIRADGVILAALNENKISFWDLDTQKEIATGKNTAGVPLVFSSDWRYLARVNWENYSVAVWGVRP